MHSLRTVYTLQNIFLTITHFALIEGKVGFGIINNGIIWAYR